MSILERKEREKEKRRQQILVAAKKLFSRKGFNKATMEDIAAEAELSPGTLYVYFKNKDELFASLSLRILQFLILRIEEAQKNGNANPEQLLENLAEALYDVYKFDPQMIIYLCHLQSRETLEDLSPELLLMLKGLLRKSIHAIADILEEGIKNGIVVNRPPTVLADMLLALFSGIVLWDTSKEIIYKEKDNLKQKLGCAFECFFQGIKKQDNPENFLPIDEPI
ncbi:TetR/AcrR family transcriptional regulator [Thermodesulfobacteriota bacterium]